MSTQVPAAPQTPLDRITPRGLAAFDLTREKIEAALAAFEAAGIGADLDEIPVLDVTVDLTGAPASSGPIQARVTDAIRQAVRGRDVPVWALSTILNTVRASMMSAASFDEGLNRAMGWVEVDFRTDDDDFYDEGGED